MKKALIIIDMQIMPFIWKDYGGKELFDEQALIRNTQLLLQKTRQAGAPMIPTFSLRSRSFRIITIS